jgi:hypothetical protein
MIDSLPPEHVVWFVIEAVKRLDTTAFTGWRSWAGWGAAAMTRTCC